MPESPLSVGLPSPSAIDRAERATMHQLEKSEDTVPSSCRHRLQYHMAAPVLCDPFLCSTFPIPFDLVASHLLLYFSVQSDLSASVAVHLYCQACASFPSSVIGYSVDVLHNYQEIRQLTCSSFGGLTTRNLSVGEDPINRPGSSHLLYTSPIKNVRNW